MTQLQPKFRLWKSKGKEFRLCVLRFNITVIVQSLSHAQLCSAIDCSTSSSPVLHHLLEFSQTHVHWVNDVIQPSYPVIPFSSCPWSLPASRSFPIKQPLGSGGKSIGVSASTSVLPMSVQGWFAIGFTGSSSLLYKGLSRIFSSTTVQKHQFFGTHPSSQSNSHIHTWPQEKP